MRCVFGGLLCVLSAVAFGQDKPAQQPPKELNYYTLGFTAKTQKILGSEDSRTGGGFSLGVGRIDPKLRIGNLKSELIWESYFFQSSSNGLDGFPAETTLTWGVLATSRYRWRFRTNINLFGDVGFGVQWANHTSRDIPLAFNTTPTLAIGLEFKTRDQGAFLIGSRLLHVSNGGRKPPNPGQNFLQFFVGFKYQH
jgi:hypothetical protein